MTWYERILDFFFIDLVEVFCEIGEFMFISPKDLVPALPSIDLFGFDLATTPLLGYFTAWIIYAVIMIRIMRLVIGG